MNAIKPGTIRKINENTMAFKMMENIESFLKAAQDYGCREIDLFQVVDLYERQNMTQVVNGIFALGRLVRNQNEKVFWTAWNFHYSSIFPFLYIVAIPIATWPPRMRLVKFCSLFCKRLSLYADCPRLVSVFLGRDI